MLELSCSEKVAAYLREKIATSDSEEFWILALNPQCCLIEARMLFKGTVDQCFFHPRDIFRFACLQNASFLVAGHNHPSGSVTPSEEDIKITKKLFKLSRMMQIPLLDHVIVLSDKEEFFSFRRNSFLG